MSIGYNCGNDSKVEQAFCTPVTLSPSPSPSNNTKNRTVKQNDKRQKPEPMQYYRGSNAVSEQFSPLVLQSVRAMPVYRENLSRPNRKRKQHLRCKRGLGKILVQRSTHTGQQGFCGIASPFAMLEHLA
ncbi:hypothetical protein T07_2486 [Trichinella nelsoni]|uniref:Uncharacterized protein n=1 Tax=Trichinella nelsoni TaxID=6336 RepID=A0A0V0RKC7_9BILA|nr:hypothetical protein T07_2486 [Trichinella nelsoni]